jgi:4-hydroxybenzoate polyprenyltransferase
VKSTALTLGDRPQVPLSVLSVGMLSGLCLAGASCDLSAPFYCGAAAMWGHSLWQIWTADINDSKNLWARFSSNKYSGGLLAASIVAGHF